MTSIGLTDGTTSTGDSLVSIARQFLYLRESRTPGQNRGLRVEAVQHWSGGATGDSWCMEFVWMCLDIAYQGHPPFDRMQSCEALRAWAADQKRIVVGNPVSGDLFLYVNSQRRAHHVGIVTGVDPANGEQGRSTVWGIAGNTSADGQSSNGDRVAEHAVTPQMFIRLTSKVSTETMDALNCAAR